LEEGEEAAIQAAMPGDDYGHEVRPDGISTLRHYLEAVWRRKWVALVPIVLVPLVVLLGSLRQDALYEASADVLVNRQEVATTALIGQTPALDDAERTMETQTRLARVPVVAERTLDAAGLSDAPTSLLLNNSVVFALADILRFTVGNEDGDTAARLASEYARQYVRYRRELDTAGLARTLDDLSGRIERLEAAGRTSSPLYLRLVEREQQLESLKALRLSNVSVVQTAQSGSAEKVAPRPRRNAAIALAAGLVVGLILVFLWETLSTRPRSDDELEALLGMPFLARLDAGTSHAAGPGGPTPEADAVHRLRTSFDLANARVGARAVMITSPHAGEGKSETVLQLGLALARAGSHVVLVDLDVRRSALSERLGLNRVPGLTSVTSGECELDEALVPVPLGEAAGASTDASARLEAVGPGRVEGHPAELLSSNALAGALEELRQRADILLIDVPPVLDAPDAAALAPRLDAVLLVMSSRGARGPTLADTRRTMDGWPVVKLGFAVTDGGEPTALATGRTGARPAQPVETERVA
jgi:Mrp family chromosome partitioning ATPase